MNGQTSAGFVDELIDLRMKLKESYAINEELKLTFRKNLGELQNTLGECVEDKDKVMAKKDGKIRDLEDECRLLKSELEQCQRVLADNPSIEFVNGKMHNYEDLCGRLRGLLVAEEKRREKSYFVSGFEHNFEQATKSSDNELTCKLIYKAVLNCLEDYQGESRHSRMVMKEVGNSWK
jgi:hypothetical protein